MVYTRHIPLLILGLSLYVIPIRTLAQASGASAGPPLPPTGVPQANPSAPRSQPTASSAVALSTELLPTVTQVRPAQGEAWRIPHRGTARVPLQVRQRLEPNDLLITGEGVWVQLLLPPITQVWIGPRTQVLLKNLAPQHESSTVELLVGKVRATLGSLLGGGEESFFLQAETVYAAPRGTDFLMERTDRRGLELTVFEGEVALGREGGPEVHVLAGQGLRLSLDGPLPAPETRSEAELSQKRQGPAGGFSLGELSAEGGGPSRTAPSLPALDAGLRDAGAGNTLDPAQSAPLPLLVPPPRTWTVEIHP